MVYQYVVALQNTNRKLIDGFSLMLCGASALLFLLQAMRDADKRSLYLIGGFLLLALTAFNAFKTFRLRQPVFYNYHLYITGLLWAGMPFYPWLSALFLVLGLIERQAKKNLEIGFADDQIVFNSFPRKTYDWSEFTNIVLKDNLLTLDFVSNKLFQRETIDEEGDAEEDEFNAYCAARLQHSRVGPEQKKV